MSKKLTRKQEEGIINLIIGWGDKVITWDALCSECFTILGIKTKRQTLAYHKNIFDAFQCKKKGIAKGQVKYRKPSSLSIAAERIFHLESKNRLLEEQNRNLNEKFIVWQYNLYKLNISLRMLDEPLPAINRERYDRK